MRGTSGDGLFGELRLRLRCEGRSTFRHAAAIFSILCFSLFVQADMPFRAAAVAQSTPDFDMARADEANAVALADANAGRLWDAQSALVEKAVGGLQPRVPGRLNIYAMAVAAGGAQQLFSREAHLALDVAAARFGSDYRGGLLLSNGLVDILHAPLATQRNISVAARALGGRLDPALDIALIYLAAHGSAEATLATDLPNKKFLTSISAESVADALNSAGIKRRIVIISACYSGTWIPALATPDTIVITAARKDRTSFGCDDRRRLTFFGAAFLEGPLARGASLREAFDKARNKVAGWEAEGQLTPSEPQVHIGKNMQTLWTGRSTGQPGK